MLDIFWNTDNNRNGKDKSHALDYPDIATNVSIVNETIILFIHKDTLAEPNHVTKQTSVLRQSENNHIFTMLRQTANHIIYIV